MKPDLLPEFKHKKMIEQDGFVVGWQSPSNIALIKYWGKKEGQMPVSPSLSMTLEHACTTTRVKVESDQKNKGLISLNDDSNHPFLPKMQYMLGWLTELIPELGNISLKAETTNTFPHSTGIASSASGLSAFALCLMSIVKRLLHPELGDTEFFRYASLISRMGSGSACRSVYGGFCVWGKSEISDKSSDEYAMQVNDLLHPELLQMRDAILIVSTEKKSLSSSMGHQAMNNHFYLNDRIRQANTNLVNVMHAMKQNDFEQLAEIVENEALSLHALMMSAIPGTILMKSGTLEILRIVREARKKGLPLFFTLDAGANVHVLYPGAKSAEVERFINIELKPCCENQQLIFDQCGNGPVALKEKP